MKARRRRALRTLFAYAFIAAFLALTLAPYVWLIMTSFKTRVDAFSIPPRIVFKPTLDNYVTAFLDKGFTGNVKNSLVVTLATTLFSLVFGLPSAYAFSRFSIRGDRILYFYLLGTRFTPVIVIALPLYLIMAKIRLLDSFAGIVVAHTAFNLAFVVWMMKGFFDTVPAEIDDAGKVDGCSWLGVFLRIVLPLTLNGVAATAIFCAINSWNEFLMALILTGRRTATLPVAIPGLLTPQGTFWGQIAAVGSVITIPVFILAFTVQRYMIRGMTFGAIK
ncbi:MAG: carbohydrate ABC transporter permease [Bacillota bacterium]